MPRYRYDYSLAPSPATGWRSRLATVLTVGAIAAISAVSGAAVGLNLLAPARTTAEAPVIVVTSAPPATAPALPTASPAAPQPVTTQPQVTSAVPQPISPPAAAPAPPAQPAPAAIAAVEEPTAHVPEGDLTFTQGYARRRAAQAAADAAAGVKPEKTESARTETARAEVQGQVGRATRTKRVARVQERRWDEPGLFGRSNERFDFGRHQALAYGDPREPRPSRRPQQGGFFGGFF